MVTDAFSEAGVAALLQSPLPRPLSSGFGAAHFGTDHTTPVNDLSVNPVFVQRLQGFPVRSRARSLSLMAPVLAFGPNFPPWRPRKLVERLGSLQFRCEWKLCFRIWEWEGGDLQLGLFPAGLEGRRARLADALRARLGSRNTLSFLARHEQCVSRRIGRWLRRRAAGGRRASWGRSGRRGRLRREGDGS